MKKILYVLVILFLSFTIFSCAKKSDDSSSSSTSTTELEGTWLSSCYSGTGFYYISTVTVSGTSFVLKHEGHNDSNCSTDNYTHLWTYSSLSIGDGVTYESGTKTGAYFSMILSSVTETMNSSYDATYANNNSYCGYSDWELNVAKDISGKTCVGTTIISANTKLLSLYKNESSNTIRLGSFNIESDGYPSSVSSLDYTKQ